MALLFMGRAGIAESGQARCDAHVGARADVASLPEQLPPGGEARLAKAGEEGVGGVAAPHGEEAGGGERRAREGETRRGVQARVGAEARPLRAVVDVEQDGVECRPGEPRMTSRTSADSTRTRGSSRGRSRTVASSPRTSSTTSLTFSATTTRASAGATSSTPRTVAPKPRPPTSTFDGARPSTVAARRPKSELGLERGAREQQDVAGEDLEDLAATADGEPRDAHEVRDGSGATLVPSCVASRWKSLLRSMRRRCARSVTGSMTSANGT